MPFKDGVTTRAEIIRKLGAPTFEMPEVRLIGYLWDQKEWDTLLIVLTPGGGGGTELEGLGHYAFFAAFDKEDRLRAHGVETSRSGSFGYRTIQDAAREWAQGHGIEVVSTPRFTARDPAPSGKALLYVYHSGGFSLPMVPFELTVDGKLQGQLKSGTYFVMVQPPGRHKVTATQINALGSSLNVDVAADKKYFVRFRIPWFSSSWGAQPENFLTFQSEQDAMPLLERMVPER